MTMNTPVLPNFLKTVLFTAAASMSLSAFAGHHEKGEAAVGDLKDMTAEPAASLDATQDELKSMLSDGEAAAEAEASNMEVDASDMMKEAKDVEIPTPE